MLRAFHSAGNDAFVRQLFAERLAGKLSRAFQWLNTTKPLAGIVISADVGGAALLAITPMAPPCGHLNIFEHSCSTGLDLRQISTTLAISSGIRSQLGPMQAGSLEPHPDSLIGFLFWPIVFQHSGAYETVNRLL